MLHVSIGGTLWLLIALGLILHSLDAPRRLVRATGALLGLMFVALVLPLSEAQCSGGPCIGMEGISDEWYDVLLYGMPGVAIAFTIAVIAYGLLRHRGARS
jgi:hypothetical protein